MAFINMTKLGWILFLFMSAVSATLSYQFIIKGDTEIAADGRTIILLEESERAFFLNEMRGFLIAVQQIIDGIEKDDMQQIATSARKVGTIGFASVPKSIVGKLPLATKKMGFATHQAFDQMAMDAESLADKEHTLSQLNQILSTCTACHSLYRLR
ncbi:hypothetical protein [sulfur-oxidizing endosymbiont of Gigantopelta aegis]|uniref:hypothetical protein n=1 Tax=sulfur-oxidizing endosymbiont of Gigantopelta aegis TaxID=2794934 RepID=UPI001FEBED0F|nr:hypothetical protein [sulfur-oxidizing endosymbiont of Gigantopelta aegis]